MSGELVAERMDSAGLEHMSLVLLLQSTRSSWDLDGPRSETTLLVPNFLNARLMRVLPF